ncbi:MAG: MscL family protein, partial [Corallococcus sp.]|nr:MscL family protein [Corallococcus sp.]
IYIDWGAFINAIINFLLIALVLFTIVKAINSFANSGKKLTENLKKNSISKEDKAEMKQLGINLRDKQAVEAYFAEKEAKAKAEEEEKQRKEAEATANAPAPVTTESLLAEIRDLLAKETK